MIILGISCFYHDSAASLVVDGEIIAAAQEERFTRKKHDFSFPKNAIEYCLKEAGISVKELDFIVFYDKPLIKFERILFTYLSRVPFGFSSFIKAIPLWLKQKLWIKEIIAKTLNYDKIILFAEHHQSHAASAFFPSPFSEAAFLTLDAVGEWTTTSYGIGRNNTIQILGEMKFPHSLGLLYSAFTYYTGFKVNSGEYKVMGLAPYGEPKYIDLILNELIDLKIDGSFKLNMKYFDYEVGSRMTSRSFHDLFSGPPRKPESQITQKEMDLACSIQAVIEEVILRMVRHVFKETQQKNLCLAGGVALNCVANGRILREGPFEKIWIQPAAGDAGCALGAALLAWYSYLENIRVNDENNDFQKGSLLGPIFSDKEIEAYLKKQGAIYMRLTSEEIPKKIASLVAQGKAIGWFNGRMEFGPRALGCRSILGDPRAKDIQSTLNLKIKFRESFRPFAPAILKEQIKDYFELEVESPYMLLVAQVKKERRFESTEETLSGFEKLKVQRSEIPAVTHVDYSSRIQSVDHSINPLFYDTIAEFKRLSGCPLIINTSFNVRGEPIVCTPKDAYLCFIRTNLEYLLLGNFLLDKQAQPVFEENTDWQKEFIED